MERHGQRRGSGTGRGYGVAWAEERERHGQRRWGGTGRGYGAAWADKVRGRVSHGGKSYKILS